MLIFFNDADELVAFKNVEINVTNLKIYKITIFSHDCHFFDIAILLIIHSLSSRWYPVGSNVNN